MSEKCTGELRDLILEEVELIRTMNIIYGGVKMKYENGLENDIFAWTFVISLI